MVGEHGGRYSWISASAAEATTPASVVVPLLGALAGARLLLLADADHVRKHDRAPALVPLQRARCRSPAISRTCSPGHAEPAAGCGEM